MPGLLLQATHDTVKLPEGTIRYSAATTYPKSLFQIPSVVAHAGATAKLAISVPGVGCKTARSLQLGARASFCQRIGPRSTSSPISALGQKRT